MEIEGKKSPPDVDHTTAAVATTKIPPITYNPRDKDREVRDGRRNSIRKDDYKTGAE